ncbi:hypothetical protein CA850_32580 [Micromonospora echinospora]|nr:hypothetical protein CA850_32580 [Micromonospora echinospora]
MWSTSLWTPLTSCATTGRFIIMYSRTTTPSSSYCEGRTASVESEMIDGMYSGSRKPVITSLSATPSWRASASMSPRCGPSPAIRNRQSRRLATSAAALTNQSTPFSDEIRPT